MAKPKVNYYVDAAIAVAFSISAVSGLVFLVPVGEGRGQVLGLSYRAWDGLHLWGSLAMIVGVLLHLVLHTKWIACMTQSVFGKRRSARKPDGCPTPAASYGVSRRRFLTVGAGALAFGGLVAGGSALVRAAAGALESTATGQSDPEGGAPKSSAIKGSVPPNSPSTSDSVSADTSGDTVPPAAEETAPEAASPTPGAPVEVEAVPDPTATPEPAVQMCVACPRGIVNDPYPGRCRQYVDRDGDGLCDHSIPTLCG